MAKTLSKKSSNTNKGAKTDAKPVGMSKITEEDEIKTNADPDEEINSGFGRYLRSSEGHYTQISIFPCEWNGNFMIILIIENNCKFRCWNDEIICYCQYNGDVYDSCMAIHKGVVLHYSWLFSWRAIKSAKCR